MQRTLVFIILHLFFIQAYSMDFGLRFNSHSFPLEKRTSLSLGETPMEFDSEFKVGFHYNFYTKPLFGTIISITTDSNHTISVVASHQGQDAYMLGLVIDDKMKLMKGLISLNPDKEDFIDVTLNKKRNVAIFRYNNDEIEMPVDLSSTNAAIARFGVDKVNERTDVAPIEVRNARIFVDNVNTNWWDFKYHDTPTTRIDEISGVEAKATNPHWLIDDHTDWTKIYSATMKDRLQTAFDQANERFYMVTDTEVKVWNPLTSDSTKYKVAGGYRPMAFSNHLAFDTISRNLFNYNLSKKAIAKFDFAAGHWTGVNDIDENDEANYANHAFAMDGNTAYTFGGYGFYKFHNDLFKIDFATGEIEECRLHPEMMPTTSASATVVNGKLYLFGGRGNSSGRQELPSSYSYALYAYDTDTWQGEKIWELDSVQYNFLPSQTMYFDNAEDCFYVATTCRGGEMIKIARKSPEITVLSTPINSKMEYHDFVFDLFCSKDGKRFYLVIDKRLDPSTHDYSIYTISAPFIEDPDIISNKSQSNLIENNTSSSWILWLIIGFLTILGATIAILWNRRKKKDLANVNEEIQDSNITPIAESTVAKSCIENPESEDVTGKFSQSETEEEISETAEFPMFDKRDFQEQISRFDRQKSAISLLGNFNVRSKDGEDITSKFTDRLKSLLILLLLSNEKYEAGIKFQRIDEEIWGDKDEKAAQNNRNVYMRKLRILLEEVGDVPITYDKGYFKIECKDVLFDYGEAESRMKKIQTEGNASPELIDETLDLLLMGPLLPMTSYEWLDQYKADFSDQALEILNKLLKYELSHNTETAFKIANTISLHEPLSEEAMKAKCILLSKKKMMGQAQKVYSKFCKEYQQCLGEEYSVSFPEVCKAKI